MEDLELKSGNFFKGQKEFRKEYRENVNGWYNGFIHLGMIFSIGGIGIYYFSSHIEKIIWWEWLIVPITLIFANLFEWWIHKYVMHKPLNFPGAKAIYSRHTLQHHQFFTEHEMRFAGTHDWRVTLFPPYALAIFIAVLSAPAVIFLNLVISSNVGWLFIITTTSFYLLYEIMHFCCHVDDNIFVLSLIHISEPTRPY